MAVGGLEGADGEGVAEGGEGGEVDGVAGGAEGRVVGLVGVAGEAQPVVGVEAGGDFDGVVAVAVDEGLALFEELGFGREAAAGAEGEFDGIGDAGAA